MQPTEWLTEFLRPMAIKPPWADRCDQEFKKEPLLDVGCGDGALASELARRGAIVAGLDADPASSLPHCNH
jgi:2-polyprenyl-3-methyl-5-hydroxy-6-metoxy-1,4-benzoquinol methylase